MIGPVTYPFLKGHGTENDFVIVPADVELTGERVRALCDRRAGIGGDGVIRAVPGEDGRWFMDYRNSDGSPSEMCGNGIRLFALHLAQEGLVDTTAPVPIGTRAGLKTVTFGEGGLITVDMGAPEILDESKVAVGPLSWSAADIGMGNPHAVAFVDSLDDAGPLLEEPSYDESVYPHGVNLEFVVRRGARHVAMRVHERGSGETRSCGTGACAVMVAAALADGARPTSDDVTYRVDVPGGELAVTWTTDDRVLLTGPAVIVAQGTTDL
jgi:diaminopimelate epimerase